MVMMIGKRLVRWACYSFCNRSVSCLVLSCLGLLYRLLTIDAICVVRALVGLNKMITWSTSRLQSVLIFLFCLVSFSWRSSSYCVFVSSVLSLDFFSLSFSIEGNSLTNKTKTWMVKKSKMILGIVSSLLLSLLDGWMIGLFAALRTALLSRHRNGVRLVMVSS